MASEGSNLIYQYITLIQRFHIGVSHLLCQQNCKDESWLDHNITANQGSLLQEEANLERKERKRKKR